MRHALRSLSLTVPLALASCADPGDEPMSTATAGVSGCDVGDSGCGEHVWSFGFGDSQIQFAMGLALDRSDGVAVIGDFAGTVDFGGGSEGALTSVDSVDVFVATRAADGSPRWARRFGEQGRQWAGGIAVDDAGDIIAVGLFEGRLEIDGVSLASTDEFDAFVIKLAGDDGHLLWATTFGGDRRQDASEVLVDDHGDIIVVGESAGTTTFAEGQAHTSQDFDVFVARLAGESGALTDVSTFDGAGDQVVKRAALDASGDLVLCGHFAGDVDFGGGELHTPDYDLFVVQLAPSGPHRWSKQIGQEGAEELTCAVTADAEDHVILTGDLEPRRRGPSRRPRGGDRRGRQDPDHRRLRPDDRVPRRPDPRGRRTVRRLPRRGRLCRRAESGGRASLVKALWRRGSPIRHGDRREERRRGLSRSAVDSRGERVLARIIAKL